ncbi:Alpha/Beta hydrolase protein [Tricladium varicosporioides]|nr:Alpha/Beta hydrolase protein [Hymenoscyphus varicosporioides]
MTSVSAADSPAPQLITIPNKPNSPISCTLFPSINSNSGPEFRLIVFVNGLGLPAASWLRSISILRDSINNCPPILTYDRFGQGLTTARDPLDGTPGKENGHDFLDVANDLHQIISTIATEKLKCSQYDIKNGNLQLLLVGASIGGPISRLYAVSHPGLVVGAIILDSNIPNVNYSDFLPDPDAPNFDPKTVIDDDCTLIQYRGARAAICKMFDLNVKNSEGLDRTTGPDLVPKSDSPKLIGPGNKGPWLTIIGHDPETFANMSFERMGTPISMSMKFTNPYWAKYNEGLLKITDEERSGKVVIAKGCGHFIQNDDPQFVADEIKKMVTKLAW